MARESRADGTCPQGLARWLSPLRREEWVDWSDGTTPIHALASSGMGCGCEGDIHLRQWMLEWMLGRKAAGGWAAAAGEGGGGSARC